jgi:hypothetical protein
MRLEDGGGSHLVAGSNVGDDQRRARYLPIDGCRLRRRSSACGGEIDLGWELQQRIAVLVIETVLRHVAPPDS